MKYIKTKSKFNNKKIQTKDGVFDSKKEYTIWQNLKLLEKQGVISDLQRQVKFVLIPSQYEVIEQKNAKGKIKNVKKLLERECAYFADFVYYDNEKQETIVVDSKSKATITPEYIIKRKLMLYIHKIKVKEIK